jgi:hypothetical protein
VCAPTDEVVAHFLVAGQTGQIDREAGSFQNSALAVNTELAFDPACLADGVAGKIDVQKLLRTR